MTTPEQLLERLAAAERSSEGPPAGTPERVWTGIEHRLVNGPAPPELDPGPLLEHAPQQLAANVGTSSGVVLKVVGALAVVGVIVAGVALRSTGDRQADEVTAPEPSQPAVRPPSAPTPAQGEPAPMTDIAVPEPEPMPDIATPEPAPEPDKPTPKSKPQPKPPAQPKTLADEVALMQALSTALKAGDPSKVLTLVAEHERDFADGQFIEERRAAKARALCQSGKLAAGKQEAQRFGSRWPDSIHLTSVNKDCGLE
jgi:outer membrane biosynthesis protein TonB